MIKKELCQCGCGRKTWIARNTDRKQGYIAGESVRFCRGHQLYAKGEKHHSWKGGHTINPEGYLLTKMPNHPRANNQGYVFDHLLIAEKALGKFLPKEVQVHHFPNLKSSTALVVCENQSYHALLHVRYKAMKTCGNKDFRKCTHCKNWDSIKALTVVGDKEYYYHKNCRAKCSALRRNKNPLHSEKFQVRS